MQTIIRTVLAAAFVCAAAAPVPHPPYPPYLARGCALRYASCSCVTLTWV